MKALKAWVDALKINHVEFQSWCNEVPSSESITFWCLRKHKIQSDEYLQWAKSHFGLAALTEQYFEQTPNVEFWNQIHTVANWSPSLLPLNEWDGVVFVGCVEPPEDVQWSFPVQYILAPADGLQKLWKQLHAGAKPAVEKTPPEKTSREKETPASLFEENELPAAPIASTPEPPASFEAMEGLNLDLNSFKLEDSVEQVSSTGDMPEGFSLSLEPTPPPTPIVMDPLKTTPTSEAVSSPEPFDALEPVKPEELNLPDPLQTPVSSMPMDESVTTSNVTSLNRNVPRHDSPEDAMIDVKKAPKDLTEAKNENDVIAWGFNKLKEHYKQSMILLFDGENLRAWKWEKSWAPRTPTTFEAFQIEKPSIFRIVKRSKLPYHGHVVPSEANQEFFLSWGLADLPEHVTALPLCIQNEPIGILLCVGEEGGNTQQALSYSERVATRLTETLSRVHSEAA